MRTTQSWKTKGIVTSRHNTHHQPVAAADFNPQTRHRPQLGWMVLLCGFLSGTGTSSGNHGRQDGTIGQSVSDGCVDRAMPLFAGMAGRWMARTNTQMQLRRTAVGRSMLEHLKSNSASETASPHNVSGNRAAAKRLGFVNTRQRRLRVHRFVIRRLGCHDG